MIPVQTKGAAARALPWLVLACILFGACGQRGDLYLPPQTPSSEASDPK